jgi:hypothetical protein
MLNGDAIATEKLPASIRKSYMDASKREQYVQARATPKVSS